MADREALQAQVMDALQAAAPVTREQALDIALDTLKGDARAAAQFEKWFQSNGDAVVEMING